MAKKFEQLTDKHIAFIKKQAMFFIGTAAKDGFVNISPKGMDSFRVINQSKIAWLNLTGNGNESAAHLLDSNRMTVMFCSFDKQPLILRLYGKAKTVHPRNENWNELSALFPNLTGARQIFELDLELVQTSCGYAVPLYELEGQRPTLNAWAEKQGREGIEQYWQENNIKSLDEKDTGIFDD